MKLDISGDLVNMPDFFIVGAAKAGTTSLYSYLGQHPSIFFPSIKEPGFFCYSNLKKEALEIISKRHLSVTDELDYISLFSRAQENQIIGEASTDYLYFYEETIKELSEKYLSKLKSIKIIILLRNPTERAWSHFWMAKREFQEYLEFEEAISENVIEERKKEHLHFFYDYIGPGLYFEQVSAYMESFGKENVKVIFTEELQNSTDQIIKELVAFLNLNPAKIDTSERQNSGGGSLFSYTLFNLLFIRQSELKSLVRKILPSKGLKKIKYKIIKLLSRKEELGLKERNLLNKRFKKDIKNLSKLLNKDLNNWIND